MSTLTSIYITYKELEVDTWSGHDPGPLVRSSLQSGVKATLLYV